MGKKVILTCANCKKDILKYDYHKSVFNFCDLKCRTEWMGRNPQSHPRWKGGRVPTVCDNCGGVFNQRRYLLKRNNYNFCSQECRYIYRRGENNPNWTGGEDACGFDTYSPQLRFCESTRRAKSDNRLLEVKCTYCGKWFIPSRMSVANRVAAINGKAPGEKRLYCSEYCKMECPVYRTKDYPKGTRLEEAREVQPELRQLVFRRDGWKCLKCENVEQLNCHHITGIKHNPIESADIDNCMTLCKKCHGEVHKQVGCKYNDLKCG